MQRSGMEWFFRLMQAPGRMAKRYLVRGPRVFGLLHNAEVVLREASTPKLRLVPAPDQPAPSAPYFSEAACIARAERPVPAPSRMALPVVFSSKLARLAQAKGENRAVSASI